jgi:hypothetical protein
VKKIILTHSNEIQSSRLKTLLCIPILPFGFAVTGGRTAKTDSTPTPTPTPKLIATRTLQGAIL